MTASVRRDTGVAITDVPEQIDIDARAAQFSAADETYPLGLHEAWPRSYPALLARPFGVRDGALVTAASSTPLAEECRTQ